MRAAGLAAAALLAAAPAAAQEVSFSGNLALLSDYVDRGLSLSGENPAGQGALYLDHASGLYAGVFASSAEDPRGNDVQLEGVLGYSTRVMAAYELDLSVSLDSFHGEDSFAYPEVAAKLSRDLGLFYAAAGLAYAPDGRWFVRDEHTVYGYGEIEVPVPRLPWLTVTAHAGYEAVSGFADRADWGLGLVAGHKALEVFLGYEDSDAAADIGDARVAAALRIYF